MLPFNVLRQISYSEIHQLGSGYIEQSGSTISSAASAWQGCLDTWVDAPVEHRAVDPRIEGIAQ
jgi:hypothetical protein